MSVHTDDYHLSHTDPLPLPFVSEKARLAADRREQERRRLRKDWAAGRAKGKADGASTSEKADGEGSKKSSATEKAQVRGVAAQRANAALVLETFTRRMVARRKVWKLIREKKRGTADGQVDALKERLAGSRALFRSGKTQEAVSTLADSLSATAAAAHQDDADGLLPLHSAAKRRAPLEVVRELIEAFRAGAAAEDHSGRLPLHWAAEARAPPEAVALLLAENEESAGAPDFEGRLPLHLVVTAGPITHKAEELAIVRALLAELPSATRCADSRGRLPLHYAAARRCVQREVIEALLAAHPGSASAVDGEGRTPADLAACHGRASAITERLLKAGSHLTEGGSTPPDNRGDSSPIGVAFRAVDVRDQGSICKRDLFAAARKAGIDTSDGYLQERFEQADEDGSGTLSFEEFRELARKIPALGSITQPPDVFKAPPPPPEPEPREVHRSEADKRRTSQSRRRFSHFNLPERR